jgi:hypothetical protein
LQRRILPGSIVAKKHLLATYVAIPAALASAETKKGTAVVITLS